MSLSGYSPQEVLPLHPPPSYNKIRHLYSYVFEKKGDKGTRKIFHNVPYEKFEEDAIKDYHQALTKKGVELPEE